MPYQPSKGVRAAPDAKQRGCKEKKITILICLYNHLSFFLTAWFQDGQQRLIRQHKTLRILMAGPCSLQSLSPVQSFVPGMLSTDLLVSLYYH